MDGVKNSILALLIIHIGSFCLKPQFSSALADTLSPQEVEDLQKTVNASEEALEERVRLASHYNELNQFKNVITYLRPVQDKLHVGGQRILAHAYSQENNHLEAIRILQYLVEKNPNDYVSHHRLGKAYLRSEKTDESIAAFHQAVKINPRFKEAYDDLLLVLEKAGRHYDLRETLVDMVKHFGETKKLLSDICKYYYEDGFLSDAAVYCKKAIDKAPEVGENHVFLGLTFLASENKERALAIIDNAAKRFPKLEFAQFTAGQLNEDSKNPSAAYKFYKQGTESDPASFRCWLGLARTAFEIRNYQESLNAFRKSCELDRSKTVQDFRSAAGKLKTSKENSAWSGKFDSEALRCRYRAS